MMRASVVVPTYNRADKLVRLLDCLAGQKAAPEFEVLVCDDGSSDHTRAVAEGAASLDLRYFHQPDLGFRAGQARNMGISAARGEIVICVDDDTLLAPDFIDAHVRLHADARREVLAIGLRHRCDRFEGAPISAAQIRGYEPDIRIGSIGAAGERLHRFRPPWRLVYSCNLSTPRTATGLLFHDAFDGWGVEDHEFGYRLLRGGLTLDLARDAPVLHVDDPAPRDPFLVEARAGQADYASYIRNLIRFLDLHGHDAEVREFVRGQLQWFIYDWSCGCWLRTSRRHDPALVIATMRRLDANPAGAARRSA